MLTTVGTLISVSVRGNRAGPLAGPYLFRYLSAILLAVAVAILTPLAHGSPPDPTWIAGLYDDADHDDAVLTITGTSGLTTIATGAISPQRPAVTRVAFARATMPPGPSRIRSVDRSPPFR